jgi:hypothetical protein
VRFIRALANASFRLWEIRNGCRHGIDNATKSQAQSEQTQREIRCLFELRKRILPQDRAIFHSSVDDHLNETQAQQRTWITQNINIKHKRLVVLLLLPIGAFTLPEIDQSARPNPPRTTNMSISIIHPGKVS